MYAAPRFTHRLFFHSQDRHKGLGDQQKA